MTDDEILLHVKKQCHAIFECPVCHLYMRTHILQCTNGHCICIVCKEQTQRCPICDEQYSATRNLSLEYLAENITFPCENIPFGCKETVFSTDKDNHEKSCPYRPYECLAGKEAECEWRGSKKEIFEHVKKEHLFCSRVMRGGKSNFNYYDYNYEIDSQISWILSAHGELFWCHSFSSCLEKSFHLSVHFIGHEENCTKYIYKLSFISSTDKNHKLLFTMQTHPYTTDLSGLIKNDAPCFSIKRNLAKLFTKVNHLRYELEIVEV